MIKNKNHTSMIKQNNKKLTYAFRYAELGYYVLPLHWIRADGQCSCGRGEECKSQGKHPLTAHGCKDATIDRETIIRWWTKWPKANIGIATGQISGIIAIDVDGTVGEQNLRALEAKYGALPYTAKQITGRGYHLIFRYPNGAKIQNAANIVDKVDIRGDGGYIVVEPSVHHTGIIYHWENDIEGQIAELPDWLLALIHKAVKAIKIEKPKEGKDGLIEEIIPEGRRNDTLTRIAGKLCRQGKTQDEVYQELLAHNIKYCKPPLSECEVKTISDSIGGREERKQIELAQIRALTRFGNAERLIDLYGQDLLYCKKHNIWYVWDGMRWKEDTGEVQQYTFITIRKIRHEALFCTDDKEREKITKWAIKSETDVMQCAMIRIAKGFSSVWVEPHHFNRKGHLLVFRNGTMNLQTGELQKHNREDLITKLIPYDYNPAADYSVWEQFLLDIMNGDREMVDFLCRAVGYSITGEKKAHALFLCYGTGRNGKSTFLNTIRTVLGDYAGKLSPDLLMENPADTHLCALADLEGKRFMVAMETAQGAYLRENLVKELTSNEVIRARRLYGHYFDVYPEHHIWLSTNHKPRVIGRDRGIWSRLKLIPFEVYFGPDKQDMDLEAKLLTHAEGILRWMVKGALWWYQVGLLEPERVSMATDTWKQEQDILLEFLEERCEITDTASVGVRLLYDTYKKWCEEKGDNPIGLQRFNELIRNSGYVAKKEKSGFVWQGIGLKK